MKLPLCRPAVLLTTAVATLAVSLPSTALAHPQHNKAKDYSPEQYAVPADLTTGPDGALDGALWFTEAHGDRIGRVTTKGEVTEYPIPTTGAFASDITLCPDGALWFTESSGNKIGRITTTGELTEYPLDTPNALPSSIVTGRDGALYFAEGNTNAITRMNAPTRHGVYISQHSAGSVGFMSYGGGFGRPLRTKSAPDAITIGPDGNLWYASGNEAKIGRVELDC